MENLSRKEKYCPPRKKTRKKEVTLKDLGITQKEAERAISIAQDPQIPVSEIIPLVGDTLRKIMMADEPIDINIPEKK